MNFVKLIMFFVASELATLPAALPAKALPAETVYFYLTSSKKWCAVTDLEMFRSKAASPNASQFDVDEGSITFKGDHVAQVEEFRTNEEVEVTMLVTYAIKPDGAVSKAVISLKYVEPQSEQTASFDVENGRYALTASSDASVFNTLSFRKADSLRAFPFSKLIPMWKATPNPEEVCD